MPRRGRRNVHPRELSPHIRVSRRKLSDTVDVHAHTDNSRAEKWATSSHGDVTTLSGDSNELFQRSTTLESVGAGGTASCETLESPALLKDDLAVTKGNRIDGARKIPVCKQSVGVNAITRPMSVFPLPTERKAWMFEVSAALCQQKKRSLGIYCR